MGPDTASLVLAVNSGSSSLKFALFSMREHGEQRITSGTVEPRDGIDGIELALQRLAGYGLDRVDVVGHRVVHGGPLHVQPARIDAALLASLRRLVPLAPLHLPACLAGIEAIARQRPDLSQVACFDTAFHATLPEVAYTLPLPDRSAELRRYGFHGLSYEYVMSTLPVRAPARIVIAHLGHGASVVAVKDGRSIDTSMGLTPSGGLMMGTRSGDLDPATLVYVARQKGYGIDELERLVERESGLLAIGGTSDMKRLLARAQTDPAARLATEMFAYAVRKTIGAFVAALGGIDLLIFTGGIGERAPWIRAEACKGLDAFGIELAGEENARDAAIISSAGSRVQVRVVETDEDLVIARHARQAYLTEAR